MSYEVAAQNDTAGAVAYCASKAIAEKAAFDFVKENNPNFDVTTLCPPMVYGPSSAHISSLERLGTSAAEIYSLMNGSSKSVPATGFFAFVDVRDLGEAHVRAFESEKAAGQRYLTASSRFTFQQICDILREEFPERKDLIPEGTPGAPFPDTYEPDNSKAKSELGMEFRDIRTTVRDMAAQFIEVEKRIGKA